MAGNVVPYKLNREKGKGSKMNLNGLLSKKGTQVFYHLEEPFMIEAFDQIMTEENLTENEMRERLISDALMDHPGMDLGIGSEMHVLISSDGTFTTLNGDEFSDWEKTSVWPRNSEHSAALNAIKAIVGISLISALLGGMSNPMADIFSSRPGYSRPSNMDRFSDDPASFLVSIKAAGTHNCALCPEEVCERRIASFDENAFAAEVAQMRADVN